MTKPLKRKKSFILFIIGIFALTACDDMEGNSYDNTHPTRPSDDVSAAIVYKSIKAAHDSCAENRDLGHVILL